MGATVTDLKPAGYVPLWSSGRCGRMHLAQAKNPTSTTPLAWCGKHYWGLSSNSIMRARRVSSEEAFLLLAHDQWPTCRICLDAVLRAEEE
jgi:hypothetical protein